jgi:hypothetical protein
VALSPRARAGLSSLFTQVPRAVVASSELTRSVYRLTFAPEIRGQLQDGTLAITQSLRERGIRALARDPATGNIAAHGTLVQDPAVIAAGVWNVLAIVTAQKFLADINDNLRTIQSAVDNLRQLEEEDKFSRLRGALDQLRKIATALQESSLDETDLRTYAATVPNLERECDQTADLIRTQLRKLEDDFQATDLGGVNLRKGVERGRAVLRHYEKWGTAHLLAIRVRAVAATLRAGLGMSHAHALELVEHLLKEREDFSEALRVFHEDARRQVPTLTSRVRSQKDIANHQHHLLLQMEATTRAVQGRSDELAALLIRTKQLFGEQIQTETVPLQLEVTLNAEGEIGTVRRLLGAARPDDAGSSPLPSEPGALDDRS